MTSAGRVAESRARPRVSVAIPLYNEEAGAPELLRRVLGVLDQLAGGPHELVLVDDGSTDRTFDIIAEAAARDGRIVIISLSRNFGHQSALTAALDHVSGDVVVVMDADLQDRPEVIPRFIDEYHKGSDVVYAIRTSRKEGWLLRTAFFLFYRLLALLSDRSLPLDAGDFGLMSRSVVDTLKSIPEHHRYLRGLRSWIGFQQIGIPIERDERFAGRSQYDVSRRVRLALDGMFAFSVVPLRVAALAGVVAIVAAIVYVIYAVYIRLTLDRAPAGFTALVVVMTFLSGVQLLFLGIVGEYVGRIYEETKKRPHYVVGRIVRR